VTSELWQALVAVADNAIEFAPELSRVGPPSIVTAEEFIAVDEPGAVALVGDDENALIAEGSNVMFYGDGGAGKTTLTIDASCHLAAGDDWLTMSVAHAVRVLIVENEGPRPLFRKKIARKLTGWAGSPLADRLLLWEEPWANFTFADETHRQTLAAAIRERNVDVVVIGPLTASGMDDAGTLQQTQEFIRLLDMVRVLCGRRVTFVLVHHENKGGKVSGAWEARGDTLFHAQGQGNGRTRLFIQKARWASAQHGTALQLVWTDGEGFAVEDNPELDDDAIAS
jgi:predicted ATP-dependent serine protease